MIALLFKPKDIQYSVYPTGKLHKDPFLVVFLHLGNKCLIVYVLKKNKTGKKNKNKTGYCGLILVV